jgi:hypothetical protein
MAPYAFIVTRITPHVSASVPDGEDISGSVEAKLRCPNSRNLLSYDPKQVMGRRMHVQLVRCACFVVRLWCNDDGFGLIGRIWRLPPYS